MTKEEQKNLHALFQDAQSWPNSWPNLAPENYDKYYSSACSLNGLRKDFYAGDTLALIEAVKNSYQDHFTVPIWAHSRLHNAFTEYLFSEGEKSIDLVLNLHKKKGPNGSPFKRRDRQSMEDEIAFHVCTLNKYLDFSLPVTFLILSKMKIEYVCKGKLLTTILAKSTIEEIYDRSDRIKFTYSKEELDDICGATLEDRFDLFIKEYCLLFNELRNNGTFHELGLLCSAMRSFQALFPPMVLLPTCE